MKFLEIAIGALMLKTSGTPLLKVWSSIHDLVVSGVCRYLARRAPGCSVYARGSYATGEHIPGLSDVDLIAAVPTGVEPEGVRKSFRRLCRLVPLLRRLVSLAVYRQEDLDRLQRATILTYGVDLPTDTPPRERAIYLVSPWLDDEAGIRARPGLDGPRAGWKLLHGGADPAPLRPTNEEPIAAWLELQRVWHSLFGISLNQNGRMTPYVCAKAVAESTRIWLRVKHARSIERRADALEALVQEMPEEMTALQALRLLRDPSATGGAPRIDEALAFVTRFSERIAEHLRAEVFSAGTTQVELVSEKAPSGAGLPLCDWRALVVPFKLDETFSPQRPSRDLTSDIAASSRAFVPGHYRTLQIRELLVTPASRWVDTLLRSIHFSASDPVTWALTRGDAVASFPNVAGWSAIDWATRAVAEHASWLSTWTDRRSETCTPRILERTMTGLRAGLFHQSVVAGRPLLPVSLRAVVDGPYPDEVRTAMRVGLDEAARCGTTGSPSPDVINRLWALLEELPAFSASLGRAA